MREPLTDRQVYIAAGLAALVLGTWVIVLAYAVVLVWRLWS